jgi:endothelin-converting enzyme/putative endopeptidase
MSPQARDVALAKLDTVYFGVGYPDEWVDASGLMIDSKDALGNVRRVERWRYERALAKLGRDVDRREWAIAPHTPAAILNFQLNAYNFAAALLQPPKFDADASDAANYGAIGAIFAHELTHFVDTLGADYDVQGAARNWWTAEDKAKYATVSQPLVAQFAAYRPLPDAGIDGSQTLVENFADLAGLASAFDAYREALGSGITQDREFFMGFARSWRATMKDDAVRVMVKSDGHAPERYRISTVRNLDAWYEAFDVKPGQRLYLPPEERVRVW